MQILFSDEYIQGITPTRKFFFPGIGFEYTYNFKSVRVYIVDKKRSKILLIKKLYGKYLAPGGKLMKGETARDAIVRDIRSGFGVEADPAELAPLFLVQTESREALDYSFHFVLDSKSINLKPFVADGKGDLIGYEWVDLSQMSEVLKWEKKGEWISEYLMKLV
jgi:ADP-ribose pyrophosphatase YjhB (NUDIX family)